MTQDPALPEALLALLAQEVEKASPADNTDASAPLLTVDLTTLLSEMTALKAEVRAETQASRQQRELLAAGLSQLETQLASSSSSGRSEPSAEAVQALERTWKKQQIDDWIDLIERLERSATKARALAQPRRRWWRTITNPAAASLAEALDLTLQRMQQKLRSWGVQRIPTEGQSFDPYTMEVLETRAEPSQPEGVVLEEIRAGYRWEDTLKRPAQVIVNRLSQQKELSS